jgi:hypothetical protein
MQVKFDFINNILLINKKLGFYPFYFFQASLFADVTQKENRPAVTSYCQPEPIFLLLLFCSEDRFVSIAENTASPQTTPSIKTTDSKKRLEEIPPPL